MADKKEQKNSKWQDRIAVAKRRKDQVIDENRWEEYIDEYNNKYNVPLGTIRTPIINEVYAYVQSSISSLYFRDPYLTVVPKKRGTVKGAYILEQAVNYFWKELKLKEEIELEIVDGILVGHGWNKTGLNVIADEYQGNVVLKGENLYSQRVSWRDILFNIASRRPPYDCQWMAHRIIKPLEWVKENFKNTSKLKGGPFPDLSKKEVSRAKFQDDIQFVTLWEVWDWEKKEVLLLAEGHDEILKESKWPDYLERFPFDMLWFNCLPDSPYPMSDIAPWNDMIKEKIKVVAQLLNHVKRWNRQALLKTGLMTDEEKDKFLQGVDGTVIDVNQTPEGNIKFVDFGAFNPDVFGLVNIIDQINRVVNGNPEIDKGGITQTKTRTLGELELVKEGARSRIDKKVDRIETHLENIARQLIANMQANFDSATIVKITGQPPEAIFEAFGDKFNQQTGEIEFTKEDIFGEYDVDVKAGSTLPMDKKSRMAVFETLLQTVAPNIQAVASSALGQVLLEGLLKDFDLPQLSEAFERELQNMAQAAQQKNAMDQLEASKTAAEAAKREAQAHQVDVKAESLLQEMVSPARIRELVEGKETKNGGNSSK